MTTRIDQFSSPAAVGGGWKPTRSKSGLSATTTRSSSSIRAPIRLSPDVVGDREVLAVICTHGHADHVAAAIELAERDEAPVALHRKDRMLWREAHPHDAADIEMEDGGIFEVADVSLEVIYAPGHTDGSVCLYCEELGVVFTGHVLLAGGPVPHDDEFPDFAEQLTAIGERLLTLPSDTRVLPGHGPETMIAVVEKKFDSWVSAGPVATSSSSPGD